MKKKSLMYKSLTQFIVCVAILLLLATPLFYWLTKSFYAEDMIDIVEAVQQGKPVPALDLEEDILHGIMIQFALIVTVLGVAIVLMMRFISGLIAASCKPASARMIGTPDLSSVCIWRLKSSRSMCDTFCLNSVTFKRVEGAFVVFALVSLTSTGVNPSPRKTSTTAPELAPSSTPSTSSLPVLRAL